MSHERFNFIPFQIERASFICFALFNFASHYKTLLLLSSSQHIRRRVTAINIHFTILDKILIKPSRNYWEEAVSVALPQRWLFDCAVEYDRREYQKFAVLI